MLFFLNSCSLENINSGNDPSSIKVVQRIYTMNTDGTNIKFIGYDLNRSGFIAQYSPDGNKIFFGNLNSINADGTGLKSLVPSNFLVWDYFISNDGKKIVFNTTDELYLINIDGSSLTKITGNKGDFYSYVCISPNDSLVAYNIDFSIGVVNSDGTNKKIILAADSIDSYFNPVFTSDGKNLLCVFQNYNFDYFITDYTLTTGFRPSVYAGRPANGIEVTPDGFALFSANNIIQKMNLTTYKVVNLTEGYEESLSNDRTKIIYTKLNDPQKAIYIYDINTGNISTIKPGFQWAVIQYPKLSPNGNQILFEADSTYVNHNFN